MGCGLVELGWGVDWWSWDGMWTDGDGMGCGLMQLG